MDNYCMSILSETQLRSDEGQFTIIYLDLPMEYFLHARGTSVLKDFVVGPLVNLVCLELIAYAFAIIS